jgi:hypothetical protein
VLLPGWYVNVTVRRSRMLTPYTIGGLYVQENNFRVTAAQTSVYHYVSFSVVYVTDMICPQECIGKEPSYFRLPVINGRASL